jgi:lipoprotein-anchoring transpeptidase ErfK/SrfK
MRKRIVLGSLLVRVATAATIATGMTLALGHALAEPPRRGSGSASSSASKQQAARVTLPPWLTVRLPDWANSVRIVKGDQPLRVKPHATAKRRGSAQREVRLPLYGARRGPGCMQPWYHVGPSAWVCGDDVQLSGGAAIRHDTPAFTATVDGLPFRYFFAGRDGSLAYQSMEEVDIGEPVASLEPGFAVAIVEEQFASGFRFGRTNRGLWVPMRDFGPARTFTFQGAEIEDTPDDTIPVAWVYKPKAPVFARRGNSFAPTGRSKERFTQVAWLETYSGYGAGYVRVGAKDWMRTRDLRHPTMAPPPKEKEIAHGARWIDIELASQTLVAYEGHAPVFATIVSTGKGRTKGHPFETPKGVHRIWVKLLTTTMDNLENEYANRYWRIEDVPYVQFFHKGVGLHAAFWHRSFGNVRSHGCVNLAPRDAQRLFAWTGPRVASGWTAALPTRHDRGTIIRVR